MICSNEKPQKKKQKHHPTTKVSHFTTNFVNQSDLLISPFDGGHLTILNPQKGSLFKHPKRSLGRTLVPGDSTGTESVTLNVVAAETWSLGDRPAGPTAPLFGQGNSVD